MIAFRRWFLALLAVGALASVRSGPVLGQGREPDNYIRYLPLSQPRLIRETDATQRFGLFGRGGGLSYSDNAPIDGIDDRRNRSIQRLAVRFAPFMVQNTFSFPLDFKFFTNGPTPTPLHIDTWELTRGGDLVEQETINLANLGQTDCSSDTNGSGTEPFNARHEDCRILALLDEFDPDQPSHAGIGAIDPQRDPFKVLYFDLPGWDERSWSEEYVSQFSGRLRFHYRDLARVYVHPFVNEIRSYVDGATEYELVLQYWFYYPLNDGGNNHEGDWEHINVVVTPIDRVGHPLSSTDITRLIGGLDASGSLEDLVIERVEYFFHHQVMVLDYTRPNVYQGREEWKREINRIGEERVGENGIWKEIRKRAYEDREETRINTHPIAYIGADNKGLDQLLAMPGNRNRDSHGTFPFPGLFKNVGPAGSAEQIHQRFDHLRYFEDPADWRDNRNPRIGGGHVQFFDDSAKVEILPDWERILPLIRSDRRARRDWSWLVLPVRWGYPATASPGANLFEHADLGNLGPIGPAYNVGWNRVGPAVGFELYEPHRLSSFYPTAIQDGYQNSLGWLNGTVPTWVILPPLDVIWRIAAVPFRALFKQQDPIYFPGEDIPFRFFGTSGGTSYQILPDDFFRVLYQTDVKTIDELEGLEANGVVTPENESAIAPHLFEIVDLVRAIDSFAFDDPRLNVIPIVENALGNVTRFSIYMGKGFTSENTLRNTRAVVGLDFGLITRPEFFVIRSDLNLWEWAGSLRFNLATDRFQPFVKVGYGYSWYRLENIVADGQKLNDDRSPWVTPGIFPNTVHGGIGLEFIPIRSFAKIPRGLDLGIRGEIVFFTHALGLSELGQIISTNILETVGLDKERPRITRTSLNFGLTVSF